MSKELTHWKKLVNPNYLGAYSMPTDKTDVILTIKHVVREMVIGDKGAKQECTVAHFVEDSKPMILNRTNCKIITTIYKTPYIEEWANCKVQIYVDKVQAFGDEVDALRIRPFAPKTELPHLVKGSKQWDQVLSYMKGKNPDIANVEKKFQVSEELKKELINAK